MKIGFGDTETLSPLGISRCLSRCNLVSNTEVPRNCSTLKPERNYNQRGINMTTIAQDAATRADIKEDRKTTTPAPTETTPATEAAPAPVSAKAKKEPAKTVSKEQTKKEPAKTVSKEQTKKEPVKPKPATAKEPVKKQEAKAVAEPFKLPKPLSGAAPIYMLFAAKRQDNVADNRRHESLNNLQEQLFLGVSVDKTILETAKANYTKEFPHLYFWISTKKVLGEMPKDLGLALQIENVLIARGKM